MKKVSDEFIPNIGYSLSESNEKGYLAHVKGEFFCPDGKSRNNRFYSRGLWEKTLDDNDVTTKLRERRMFGTISHDQDIDDKALLDGKISHVVTDLRIDDEGRGIGEALILDTPAGNILNAVFKAGCKLFTSSRAYGSLTNETVDGVPKVDEDEFQLETFDFVLDPGFIRASPSLVESYNDLFETKIKIEPKDTNKEISMELTKLVEKLSDELVEVKSEFKSASETVDHMKTESNVLMNENATLKKNQSSLLKRARNYKKLGEAKDIAKVFNKTKALVRENRRIRKELAEFKKHKEKSDV